MKNTTTIVRYRGQPPPLRCLARWTLSVLLKSVVLSLNLSSEFELQSNLHSSELSCLRITFMGHLQPNLRKKLVSL
ncbi:hypothetical protein Pint_25580 [Pistacia integerrima]|uniref:Uncharacterized protein n=1 Tax=Pistacia integerrima TaxID=434235 RepID=A0ACC0YGX2_9ROSI|nr:hypothetical protein Pint_25580 [Pistacia integerrima]